MNFCFDMDGTIADLYAVENWLDSLNHKEVRPYQVAKPMMNFSALARRLNAVQRAGHTITIISWTSKNGGRQYNEAVAEAKRFWLEQHLPSVKWDYIYICAYGTPKEQYKIGLTDILFDDNEEVRNDWGENSFEPSKIMDILKFYK